MEKKIGIIKKTARVIMTVYVLFLLCIFPLAVHDKYFDIHQFRFDLYWKTTCVVTGLYFLLGILYFACRKIDYKEEIKENNRTSIWHSIRKRISATDILFFLFILIQGISTLLAPYQYEAFWGNQGRDQGLFLWLWFFITYVLITRFYEPRRWHIYVILFASLLPCLWGISGFFLYDLFGFHVDINERYTYIFTSSFGNINTYSCYTGMMFAFSAVIFCLSKHRIETILSLITLVVVTFAHIMSISDNSILSTGAIFLALPFLTWKDDGKFIRSFGVLITFLICLAINGYIWKSGIPTMNQLGDSILISLGATNWFYALTAICVIVFAILMFLIKRQNRFFENINYKKLKIGFGNLVVFAIIAMIGIFCYANRHPEKIPFPFSNILIFNDTWGTGRGLCWRLGMEYYIDRMPLHQKLFGYGPDTYYIMMMDNYLKIMQSSMYGLFDSAHNEYLEYLVTTGIFGLLTYILIIIRSITTGVKKSNIFTIASALAVFAYAAQATANIAIPIATPIYIAFLSISNLKKV